LRPTMYNADIANKCILYLEFVCWIQYISFIWNYYVTCFVV